MKSKILKEFNIDSNRGFLPTIDPIIKLSDKFSEWDKLGKEMSSLLTNGDFRKAVLDLPDLDISTIEDGPELERAMLLLSMFANAFVWSGDKPKKITLKAKGPGAVKASQITTGHDVEIVNPDLVLCHLNKTAKIDLEMTVENGKGYVPAEQKKKADEPVGLLLLDTLYSPVRKVSFKIENSRVGQITDYDKLILNVETDGTIAPDDAIAMAAHILQEQLQYFINFEEPEIQEKAEEEELEVNFNKNLLRKVDELELSVRSANCLRNDNIVYIGDLVQKSENDMLRTPNFGRKSLNEIREVLMQMGLNLGMDISEWPPENIEELSKNLDENI